MALEFARDADILAMFADSPHTITAGEVTGPCWLDDFDQEVELGRPDGGGQVVRVRKATVQTGVFPDIKNDVVVAVGGGDTLFYTVWNHLRIGDGALTELYLRPRT